MVHVDCFSEAHLRLGPEDCGRELLRVPALRAGREREQVLRNGAIGRELARCDLRRVMLAERRRADIERTGDLILRDAELR